MVLAATWMDLEIIILSEVKKVEDKWRSNKKILKTSEYADFAGGPSG